ncbi:MAG: sigma-B regulation protein RsbU (phosphoserine phosphatase) [Motiliproteus sp.]|jgi:sigma-B regulation protein RsbU (phosphoserine phosphatase)
MSSQRYCVLVTDGPAAPALQEVIALLTADATVELRQVSTAAQALECIAQRQPDLLLTLPLPAAGAGWLARVCQAMHPNQVIALEIGFDEGAALRVLRQGAADLFFLPLTEPQPFKASLRRLLERAELVSQTQYFREELERSLGLLQEDQQAGRHVQQKMLPPPESQINGYHFEFQIKPSLLLSGDFVDYFRISESLSMFYLADISGHGASSAFVTVLLKNMTNRLLRNYNRGSSFDILSPVAVLERVNKEFLETGLGKHMTIFIGLLDGIENTLQYGVGGHFPMPILRQGTKTEYLGGCGMPVGLFEDAQFEGRIVELDDEFCLTLFSDGVLEVLPQPNLKAKEKSLLDAAARGYDDLSDLAAILGVDQVDEAPDDIAALSVSRRL